MGRDVEAGAAALYFSEMDEVELKFELAKDALRDVLAALDARYPEAERSGWKTLRSIYFDTEDHRLRAAGLALRLRAGPEGWVQTVKAGRGLSNGLSKVQETDVSLKKGQLDLAAFPEPLRAEIGKACAGEDLRPVTDMRIRRHARILRTGDGGAVEVAIDSGLIKAGGKTARLREVEFELVEGGAGTLFELAADLVRCPALRLSVLSKGARGELLAREGRIAPYPVARKAQPVVLSTEHSREEAALLVLRECVAQVLGNARAVEATASATAVHQLRVGLRRLRVALMVFKKPLGKQAAKAFTKNARFLARTVGRVRDLDVLVSEIIAPLEERGGNERGFSILREELERRARAERLILEGVLKTDEVQTFLFDLLRLAETGTLPGDQRSDAKGRGKSLEKLFRKRLGKLSTRIRDIAERFDDLDIEARHDFRKELKTFRYAIEFASPLFAAEAIRPYLKSVKRIQNVLGRMNDAATAENVLRGSGMPLPDEPSAERAAGWILGYLDAEAEADLLKADERIAAFLAQKPFWT